MKKLIVFLGFVLFLCLSFVFKVETNPLFSYAYTQKVCLISEQEFDIESTNVMQSGDKFFTFLLPDVAKDNIFALQNQVDAVQFYLDGDFFEEAADLISFQETSRSSVGDMQIFLGYSPFYEQSSLIDGKKNNVQIALTDDVCVIGFPFILTSF